MKPILPLLAGAALIAAVFSFWSPLALAEQTSVPVAGKLPVGQRCIVTLDPKAGRDPQFVHLASKKSGLAPENTAEGDLVSMDGDWLVLREGSYENWIPQDKVLFLRVSR